MTKLNQIVALANGVKSRTQSGISEIYHKLQATTLLEGISRTYRPKDDDGEQLPPESKRVQFTSREAIKTAIALWEHLFDTVLTQDTANCSASSDVVIDDITVLSSVPVTHLLFLEKQLTDIKTFVGKIPTLDPAYKWSFSDGADCYSTEAAETARTKKIPRNHVKAEATKEHPEQVEIFLEDVVVGYWKKVDFSGAILASEKNRVMGRIHQLQDAIKNARENANSMAVDQRHEGRNLFSYIFEDTAS